MAHREPASRETAKGEPRYPYVHVDVSAGDIDAVSVELFDLGAGGVEERDGSTLSAPDTEDGTGAVTLVASFPDEATASAAQKALASRFPARLAFVEGDAWRDGWKAFFAPARIGQRLVVRPSWEDVETWPGEVVLTLDPGHAFGSGTHETTRLVLRELDRRVGGGEAVLDVGCGSGILGIAALLLGAERVRAIDVDPDAVEVTRDNAQRNGVEGRLEASTTPVGDVEERFDIVLSNIETRTLVPLSDAVASCVAPGGLLILSGILRGEQDAVIAAYAAQGLRRRIVTAEGGWVAVVMGR